MKSINIWGIAVPPIFIVDSAHQWMPTATVSDFITDLTKTI